MRCARRHGGECASPAPSVAGPRQIAVVALLLYCFYFYSDFLEVLHTTHYVFYNQELIALRR